ncbi:EamA family transporter [Variovorax sp. ZT5P49]|uniref:EamA family transporter n=1 Tax=Variovorax sp. ZT5P49 TaxID=3443733 RepID=UPI003F451B95
MAIGTAIAVGSGPAWAGLLQAAVYRKPPAPVWWAGTLLAIGGGGLMVMSGSGGGLRVDLTGLALCLASGLCYAIYTLVSQRLVSQSPPATVTLWVFAVASVIAMPTALSIFGPFSTTPSGWVLVAYLGLVSTGIAYLLFSHALQHISGGSGVTLALAEPVTAFAARHFRRARAPSPFGLCRARDGVGWLADRGVDRSAQGPVTPPSAHSWP